MCSRPFETRSRPPLSRRYPRGFAFYVAFPKSSIRPLGFAHLCRSRPRGSVHTLLPSLLRPVRLGPFHVAQPRSVRSLCFFVSFVVKIFRFAISEIVFTCNDSFVSAQEPSDKDRTSNDSAENSAFNGAELSESVLGRDWNSPEEDAAWSNL